MTSEEMLISLGRAYDDMHSSQQNGHPVDISYNKDIKSGLQVNTVKRLEVGL